MNTNQEKKESQESENLLLSIMIKKIRNLVLFAIITVVVSAEKNDNVTLTNWIHDVKRLEQALHTASAYMVNEAKPENVAVCIGSTRSGKSSLINYLIGNKLTGRKVTTCKPVALIKADNSPGPEIGIGSTSETRIPTRWESTKFPGLGIWDAPGFDDNRGSVQDITNAFYIYQLLKHVKSLKIVLVTDINDIANDNIRPFLTLLNSVENLLKDRMRDCFSSITIIFTKVPEVLHENLVNKNFINQLLEEQFLSSPDIDISDSAKDFIRFLTKNNQNFGFFKKATVGEITNDSIDEGIIQAIESTKSLKGDSLKNVSPSISHESKVFLYDIRQELSSVNAFQDILIAVRDIFSNKLNELKNIGENKETLYEVNQKLAVIENNIQKSLDPLLSISKKIESIQAIDPLIEKLIKDNNLKEKAKLMDFVDSLLDLKESSQFDIHLQGIMLNAMAKVEDTKLKVKVKLGEMDDKEAEARALQYRQKVEKELQMMKYKLEEMRIHNEMANQKLGFFGKIGKFLDNLF